MKSEIHDAAAAWQSCESVIGDIREELQMAEQFCNNYKDASPQSHLEAVNLGLRLKFEDKIILLTQVNCEYIHEIYLNLKILKGFQSTKF